MRLMHAPFSRRRLVTMIFAVILATWTSVWEWARAEEPAGGVGRAAAAIAIAPRQSRLIGRRATQQLIATARAADGSVQDVTRAVEWVSRDPAVAVISPK